jgi:K+-transporting ATPase KdpF subunit
MGGFNNGRYLAISRDSLLFTDDRSCGRMPSTVQRRRVMSTMYLIGIVVTVLMFGYLVYALIKAEKF